MLGVPLPASTQWDTIRSYEPILKKAYEALEKDAAQAICFHIDDTKARVLEALQRKEQQADNQKRGKSCFTTGMVCLHEDHRSTLFITDNRSAGKTFAPFLTERDARLEPPFVMADALTANIPTDVCKDLYTMCYCLVHARRNFYSLGEGYDDLVEEVIDLT